MIKLKFCLIIGILFLAACSKDSTTPVTSTLVSSPEAIATENTSSGGIYKGVFVGSSGVFKIALQKGRLEVTLTFDGTTRTLTSTSLSNWATGQAITNAVFTSGDWSLTFSVAANGSAPTVTITIPGHTISASIHKETSTTLIKGYEGTYTGSESGVWNLIIKGGEVVGIAKNATTGDVKISQGTLVGNTITIDGVTGTTNGDNISGTWGSGNQTGTWSGKRTL